MGETLKVQVECYSDSAYADRPLVVIIDQERFNVSRVLTEDRTPTGKHFRVELENGHEAELIYNEAEDSWIFIGPI